MKNLKNLIIGILTFVALGSVCLFGLAPKKDESNAAVVDTYIFNYVSISQADQVIDNSKFQTINNSTYIVTNKSVTMTFKPLSFNYKINSATNLNNFFPNSTTIEIEKNDDGEYLNNGEFTYNDSKYFYSINASKDIFIYNRAVTSTSSPVASSAESSLISYDDNTKLITIIESYTSTETGYKDNEGNDSSSCVFSFTVGERVYNLYFEDPVINFYKLSEPVVMFNTYRTDDGGIPYPEVKAIAPDEVFKKLQISFVSNKYTEGNPLYFNINFNGFIYNYKMFSKVIDGENLLFVNYIDEYSSTAENISYNNSEYLATAYMMNANKEILTDEDGKPLINESTKVSAEIGGETNNFSLIFNTTGRYFIEFYDSTHLLGMANANYYSQSFFIREDAENVSPFDNVYVVAQTFTDEGNPIEYIVSDSTLNYSTKITIKNLGDFGEDADGKPIELADVIEDIKILKTDFGIDHVETITTTYTVEDLLSKIVNNDFTIEFTEDAYYQVIVNPKQKTKVVSGETVNVDPVRFVFTIVKYAKTTYTFNNIIYEATTPYKTEIKNYTKPIASKISFNTKVETSEEKPCNLDKTYVNRFSIKFGVKRVSIETYTPVVGDNEKLPDGIYLKIYGVGDITTYITFNGQTEVLTLNSEAGNNTIDRLEYGTYTIKIVDSMGSEYTGTYTLSKKLNTSALVLIILISIIATVIIVFIMKARGKVATR